MNSEELMASRILQIKEHTDQGIMACVLSVEVQEIEVLRVFPQGTDSELRPGGGAHRRGKGNALQPGGR